eukprot:gene8170-1425_t
MIMARSMGAPAGRLFGGDQNLLPPNLLPPLPAGVVDLVTSTQSDVADILSLVGNSLSFVSSIMSVVGGSLKLVSSTIKINLELYNSVTAPIAVELEQAKFALAKFAMVCQHQTNCRSSEETGSSRPASWKSSRATWSNFKRQGRSCKLPDRIHRHRSSYTYAQAGVYNSESQMDEVDSPEILRRPIASSADCGLPACVRQKSSTSSPAHLAKIGHLLPQPRRGRTNGSPYVQSSKKKVRIDAKQASAAGISNQFDPFPAALQMLVRAQDAMVNGGRSGGNKGIADALSNAASQLGSMAQQAELESLGSAQEAFYEAIGVAPLGSGGNLANLQETIETLRKSYQDTRGLLRTDEANAILDQINAASSLALGTVGAFPIAQLAVLESLLGLTAPILDIVAAVMGILSDANGLGGTIPGIPLVAVDVSNNNKNKNFYACAVSDTIGLGGTISSIPLVAVDASSKNNYNNNNNFYACAVSDTIGLGGTISSIPLVAVDASSKNNYNNNNNFYACAVSDTVGLGGTISGIPLVAADASSNNNKNNGKNKNKNKKYKESSAIQDLANSEWIADLRVQTAEINMVLLPTVLSNDVLAPLRAAANLMKATMNLLAPLSNITLPEMPAFPFLFPDGFGLGTGVGAL